MTNLIVDILRFSFTLQGEGKGGKPIGQVPLQLAAWNHSAIEYGIKRTSYVLNFRICGAMGRFLNALIGRRPGGL